MSAYTERDFVRALIPLLISRLPDPFSPNEADLLRIEKTALQWSELLDLSRRAK